MLGTALGCTPGQQCDSGRLTPMVKGVEVGPTLMSSSCRPRPGPARCIPLNELFTNREHKIRAHNTVSSSAFITFADLEKGRTDMRGAGSQAECGEREGHSPFGDHCGRVECLKGPARHDTLSVLPAITSSAAVTTLRRESKLMNCNLTL